MRFLLFVAAAILVAVVAAWAWANLRRRAAALDLTIEPPTARRSLLEPVPLAAGAATAVGAMLLLAAVGLVDDAVAVIAACLAGVFAAAAAAAFAPTKESAGSEERRVALRWSAAADVMDRIAARASKDDRDLFRSMASALRGVAQRAGSPRQARRLARFSRVALPRIVTLSAAFVETLGQERGDLERRRANLATCARAIEKIERDCAEREIEELDVDLDVLASQIERLAT